MLRKSTRKQETEKDVAGIKVHYPLLDSPQQLESDERQPLSLWDAEQGGCIKR